MNLKVPFNNKKNSMSYLLKNGKLINLKEKKVEDKDLLLENKKIKHIKKGINISSKDVSANKPSENHFHKAIELLGVSKKELLHIGDHKINDMHGAISYGIEALWFNPNKEIWDLEGVEKPPEFSIWKGLTEKIDSLYS